MSSLATRLRFRTRRGGGITLQSWIEPGAHLHIDFVNDRAWYAGTYPQISELITNTRTDAFGQIDNLAGIWSPVAANFLRYSNKGLLVQGQRINLLLWSRDLTNIAWVKSNVTAAKDQVGIDGVFNSASSIVSTAGNGTVLQSITSGSASRQGSTFVKRITGSGVVEMTLDNGGTWTGITVTATWTRVTVPTATVTNPIVGFRIVTSGDAIAVDGVQIEASGVGPTSPIFTTTATGQRNSDNVSFLQSRLPSWAQATVIVEALWLPIAIANAAWLEGQSISGLSLVCNAAGTSPRVIIRHGATSRQDMTPAVTPAANAKFRVGATWDAGAAGRGAANGTFTAGAAATQADFTGTVINLGARAGTSLHINSYITQLILKTYRSPSVQFDRDTIAP